jgi:hypothetical protein
MKTMLSTIDNPHSPFTDFGAWYAYDISSGYHTASFLARIVKDSDQLSEKDLELAIEQAIDEIVLENVSGIYVKLTQEE